MMGIPPELRTHTLRTHTLQHARSRPSLAGSSKDGESSPPLRASRSLEHIKRRIHQEEVNKLRAQNAYLRGVLATHDVCAPRDAHLSVFDVPEPPRRHKPIYSACTSVADAGR